MNTSILRLKIKGVRATRVIAAKRLIPHVILRL